MSVSVPENMNRLRDAYQSFFELGCVIPPDDYDLEGLQSLFADVSALASSSSLNPYVLQYNEKRPPYMASDGFVDAAAEAGLRLCGSTLVWNGQLPAMPPGTNPESLVRYVGDACLHFSGRVSSWTVVSEALQSAVSEGPWRARLRDCLWKQAFGGGTAGSYYLDVAFRTARGTAPDAKLYYGENVFDAEGRGGSLNHAKLQALVALVSDINRGYRAEGYGRDLIEGISLRGSFTTETPVGEVETALRQLAPLGVGIEFVPLRVDAAPAGRSAQLPSPLQAEELCIRKLTELLCLFRLWAEHIDRVMFAKLPEPGSERYLAFTRPEFYLGGKDLPAPPTSRPVARAQYGSPAIDGMLSSLWHTAEPIKVTSYRQGWPSAHGTARALWDEQNLYVLAEVRDETQDCSGPLSHEHDSVEIYVSETGHYETFFQEGDALYRVNCENNRSVGLNARSLEFDSAVNASRKGYMVQMRIPVQKQTLSAGLLLGFDVQINDAEGSTRVGMATWHERDGEPLEDPTVWGRLLLCRSEERPEERLERRSAPSMPEAYEAAMCRAVSGENVPSVAAAEIADVDEAVAEIADVDAAAEAVAEIDESVETVADDVEAVETAAEAVESVETVAETAEIAVETAVAIEAVAETTETNETAETNETNETVTEVAKTDETVTEATFETVMETAEAVAETTETAETVTEVAETVAEVAESTEIAPESGEDTPKTAETAHADKSALSLSELLRLALGDVAAVSRPLSAAAERREIQVPAQPQIRTTEAKQTPEAAETRKPLPTVAPETTAAHRSRYQATPISDDIPPDAVNETPPPMPTNPTPAPMPIPQPQTTAQPAPMPPQHAAPPPNTDTEGAARKQSAGIVLDALDGIDSVEAALDSIRSIDEQIAASAFITASPVPPSGHLSEAEREQLRQRLHLRLFLGAAAMGIAGLTVWRLTRKDTDD